MAEAAAVRISAAHRERYREHYETHPVPIRPSIWVEYVQTLATHVGAKTMLDYGSGPARGLSCFVAGVTACDYDPGVPEIAARPKSADLVCCIHTLEHVEDQAQLDEVMLDLRSLAKRALFVVASCQASTKLLPDGTPWHTFVRDLAWWRAYLSDFREQPALRPGAEYAALLEIA